MSTRRLAAILAADVVGYSRLMGADEEGTLARLKACRRELIDPKIAEHHGRIVKTTGDGMLVEFASAVDAARCAVEVQRAMTERGAGMEPNKRIEIRIGIHVGDIIIDGDDIFGDGVNIAARLEGIAEPGGITISGAAHEQVRDRLPYTFEDGGEQNMKNIARPVRVYRVRADGSTTRSSIAMPPSADVPLALPDKPSIAVLPFQNMSGDPEQEYFADGMVEDIITALSRTKALFVIARNSSFSYKGKSPDIRQVGRELGVRYVLEGSVRKAANRIRITGQLIDASTGLHIWADRFEGGLESIFELQDQVTSCIVGAIAPRLELAEIERTKRKITNLQAYDYYLRGLAVLYRFSWESQQAAWPLLQKAAELDPEFALAHAAKALWYVANKGFGWAQDHSQEMVDAERVVRRALELDRNDPRVLAWAGHALCFVVGHVEEGSALLNHAVELDSNLAMGWVWGGVARTYLGDMDAAINYFKRALRLSPLDPLIFLAQSGMARAQFFTGHYDEALAWSKTALQHRPNHLPSLRVSIASYALAGRVQDAQKVYVVYRKIDPSGRIGQIRHWQPLRRDEDVEKFAEGLRLAGMPE
jgi:TolB-like protein/class 3 adenylate cyclase/Tfp pilus assembly protein PilF